MSEVNIPLERINGDGQAAAEPTVVITNPQDEQGFSDSEAGESVERPAKVMRIGSMIKQLLDEVRQAELDEPSRVRLKEIYELSVRELADTLSPTLAEELDRLALPFESPTPTDAELRIAQAQLVGWLEGLFHGIQATLFAQQVAAQNQLEEMRRRSLPSGDSSQQRLRGGGNYL
ncbi:MAG TPA: bacterial proteasome activator family protein [Acidimicrobiales bacterium]|nr:bacterial proteasome activator family protein [Acidimicrobiales bacterium]